MSPSGCHFIAKTCRSVHIYGHRATLYSYNLCSMLSRINKFPHLLYITYNKYLYKS